MALFSIDIEKFYLAEYWTNRYIVNASDLATADTYGHQIVEFERAIHVAVVQFTKLRTADAIEGNDVYKITPLGLNGARSASGAPIPLFNVVRCDFSVATGRPSRKYLRLPLMVGEVSGNTIASGVIGLVNVDYVEPLVAAGFYVDVDGQPIIDGTTMLNVGMRQLRRGSKRKLTPVLPS